MEKKKVAKKETKAKDIEVSEDVRNLPVKLTKEEIDKYYKNLLDYLGERDSKVLEKASFTKKINSEVAEFDKKINDCRNKINSGCETKEVKIEKIKIFKENKLKVIRKDTGQTIEERALTFAERQTSIPLKENDKKSKKEKDKKNGK